MSTERHITSLLSPTSVMREHQAFQVPPHRLCSYADESSSFIPNGRTLLKVPKRSPSLCGVAGGAEVARPFHGPQRGCPPACQPRAGCRQGGVQTARGGGTRGVEAMLSRDSSLSPGDLKGGREIGAPWLEGTEGEFGSGSRAAAAGGLVMSG